MPGTRRGLLLGAGASVLAALPVFASEPTLLDDGYFEIWEEVAPRIAVIRQARPFHLQPIGNVTVIEQSDGLVLVDSGGSPGSGRRIVGLLKRHRPGRPVKAVILTHWHGDHPLGLPEILKAWPEARTIATEATKAHLSDPRTMNTPAAADAAANAKLVEKYRGFAGYCYGMADKATTDSDRRGWAAGARVFAQYAADMDGALTVAPREGFAERLVIEDGVAPVEALFLGRGNTDGDAVVWMPKQQAVATGDLLVAPIPFGFGSYPTEWLATLKKVRALAPEIYIPGHGAPMERPAGERYLVQVGALVEMVRNQVKRLAGEGLDEKATRAAIDLRTVPDGFTGGDPWLRRWFDSYFVDPMVASAWKEAKGKPIVQSLEG